MLNVWWDFQGIVDDKLLDNNQTTTSKSQLQSISSFENNFDQKLQNESSSTIIMPVLKHLSWLKIS